MTWQTATVAVTIGLVASEQAAITLQSLRGGISEFDSLAYHLPTAARWVQHGSLSAIHQLYPGSLWAYYPYNAEVLHAIGMAAFGRDLLSPLLNLGFAALVFLAAWSIGSARNAGASAVLAAAMILATYQFSEIGGGTALNDIPAVAMVLTMVALAARATRPEEELMAAALAGGWAIGTKPDAALTVLVVAIGAIVLARSKRVSATATWIAGLLVAGGYWYIRDLVTVETPLPGLHTGVLPTRARFHGRSRLPRACAPESTRSGRYRTISTRHWVRRGPLWSRSPCLVW